MKIGFLDEFNELDKSVLSKETNHFVFHVRNEKRGVIAMVLNNRVVDFCAETP